MADAGYPLPRLSGSAKAVLEVASRARELSAFADVDDLLDHAARVAIPVLADLCVLVVENGIGETTDRLKLVTRHADPEFETDLGSRVAERLPELIDEASRLHEGGRVNYGLWLATMRNPLARHLFAQGERAQLARDANLSALIVVPINSPRGILGAFAVGRTGSTAYYTGADFAAVRSIADRIGLAIHAARLRASLAIEDARRARAEDAVLKWTHAFQHAPYGAAIVEPDGRFESVNLAFARMHGYVAPTELKGLWLSQLTADGAPVHVRAVQHGMTWEGVQRRSDGSTFPALLSDTPLRGSDGQLLYRAVTVQDLTAMRRTEEQLRHAQRLEALGRLAGGVAHEVNNMMTIVLGFADLLAQAPELTEEHRGDVHHVIEAAERASTVSRQLLAYGRQQILRPSPIVLNQLVEEAVGLLRPLISATITVHTELGDLGESGVYADAGQLEQVLVNLALNARDAMPEGGELRISTALDVVPPEVGLYHLGFELSTEPYALLTVADTGLGMDAETLAHAFDPFFTTKPVGQGTGLGLATVYGIVKQSGGYIWADSDPGRGTTFTVCLPAVRLSGEATARGEATVAGGSARVLVVDDEPGVRQLSTRMLRRLGYDAVATASGAEALDLAEGSLPDVVLTDLMMPGMDGRELRDALRTRHPELPVIIMSGHPAAEMLRQEGAGPRNQWISKPFSLATLAAHLQQALANHPVPKD